MLALLTPTLPPALDSLEDYPHWFVVACVVILALVAIWVLGKILKWAIRLLLVASLVIGALFLAWLFLH